MQSIKTAIGLMSGTSMDGIDAALIDSDGEACVKVRALRAFEYTPEFRQRLKQALEQFPKSVKRFSDKNCGKNKELEHSTEPSEVKNALEQFLKSGNRFSDKNCGKNKKLEQMVRPSETKTALEVAKTIMVRHQRPRNLIALEEELTSYHVQIVRQLLSEQNLSADEVDLIGFHGQTILHRPDEGLSVQLGLGAELARQTGIDVIYDMRANDMAHGGQGAPLTPAYHAALAMSLRDRLDFPCCFVNIGGIANLTYVPFPEGDVFTQIIAFDCGPGNCLIDQWMEARAELPFDAGGQAGLRGRVDEMIIKDIMKQAVFSTSKPQSFDWRDFQPLVCEDLSVEDGAAMLAHLTAWGIIHSFRFLPHRPKNLVVSGGGGKNACMMAALSEQANKIGAKVIMAEECGLQADFIEAEAWAYLAIRAFKKLPLSFPATTGVQFPVTGGVFAPASR